MHAQFAVDGRETGFHIECSGFGVSVEPHGSATVLTGDGDKALQQFRRDAAAAPFREGIDIKDVGLFALEVVG